MEKILEIKKRVGILSIPVDLAPIKGIYNDEELELIEVDGTYLLRSNEFDRVRYLCFLQLDQALDVISEMYPEAHKKIIEEVYIPEKEREEQEVHD